MIKDTSQMKQEMKIFLKMVLDKLGRMTILYRIFSDVIWNRAMSYAHIKILGISDCLKENIWEQLGQGFPL